MKKSLLSVILVMLLCLVTMTSCQIPGLGGGPITPGGKEEPENLIYNSSSDLYIILGEGADPELALNLQNSIDVTRGKISQLAPVDSEAHTHELVIGNTDREISKKAKERLLRLEKNSDSDLAYLVYSDGASVAIVFDDDERDVAEKAAIEYFEKNYVISELILKSGVAYSEFFDVIEYYRVKDEEHRAAQWLALKNALDPSYAEEFVVALQQLYSLYTPDVVTWLANLYEPNICICYGLYGETECKKTRYCGTAGFYYSNSGRDTMGYLPDVESTSQSLGVLESWGISYLYDNKYARWLPEEMKLKMGLYAQALQDENGFFYHPQWGKDYIENNNKDSRRARDLGHATGLISLAGLKPLYTTPTGVQGSTDLEVSSELTSPFGGSKVTAVSRVVLAADEKHATHLESVKTFKEYLESYDIRNSSYSVGNRVGSQISQIQARDKVIGTESDPTPLMDTLIKYLVKNQNPETGCWNWKYVNNDLEHSGSQLYESVNGLLKIGGDFTSAGVIMPYAEEAAMTALAAVTDPQPLDAVTSLYNTWFAFRNILTNLRTCKRAVSYDEATDTLIYETVSNGNSRADALVKESRAMAIEGIRVSREKIAVFKKADGSFSYTPNYSAQTSQGCQVALPNSVEGDVNATVISIMGIISNTLRALELEQYKPILFGEAERLIYLDIINNAHSVKKNEVEVEGEPITFDYEEIGTESEELVIDHGGGNGTAQIVADPRDPEEGKITKIVTHAGVGDYITVPNQSNSALATTYVFESEFMLESSSLRDDSYFVQFYMGRNNYTAYFFTLTLKDGEIIATEHSSTSWATAVTRTLGKVGNLGEWFKIKVEYYYSESMDDVRIKFYYDDDLTDSEGMTLLAVTDNFYDASGNKYLIGSATPCKYYEYTKFYMMKDAEAVLYMDNCMSYKNQTPYIQVTDPNNQPLYNVDPPESPEKKYSFDTEGLPEDITFDAGTGEISVKDNALNLVGKGASGGPLLTVPVNIREIKSQCVNISLDIACKDAAVGSSLLRFVGKDGSSDMFGFDLVVREDTEGKYLTVREYNGEAGEVLDTVRIPINAEKSYKLGVKYFHREDKIIFYVDGEFLSASSLMYTNGIKGTMNSLSISTVGNASYDLSLDNIIVEKVAELFIDAVAPTTPSKPHSFASDDSEVKITGSAAVSGGQLVLNSKAGAATVTVPMHTRSNLQNIVKFSAKIKFTENVSRGETHKILFKDAEGKVVFALALVYDGTFINLCQVAEGGTVAEPIYSYSTKDVIDLTLEIYQDKKDVQIFEDGTCKAKTGVFYNPENVMLRIASVTVSTSTVKSIMNIDDVVLEEFYTSYKKATISSKVQPNEKISDGLSFELSNSGKLPTTSLTLSLNTPLAASRVERFVNTLMTDKNENGEWSNVLALDTGKGGNDSVIFNSNESLGEYTQVTFEADIKLESFKGTAFQIYFADKTRNHKVYMLTLEVADGKIHLTDNSSNSYKDNPNVNTFSKDTVALGEWFRLRVEIYKSTNREDVRFKVYVNDELCGVSDNFHGSHDDSKLPNTDTSTVQVMSLADAVGTIYFDNVTFNGSYGTCKDDVTVPNSPNN